MNTPCFFVANSARHTSLGYNEMRNVSLQGGIALMSSLAGYFLVARPVLDDPNFHRTVVLLLQHGPEGAFGLVVNRAVGTDKLPFPVYLGGPCKLEGRLLLHGHAEWRGE